MQRIKIVGTTGTGKSTLASALSQRLALPHIKLDYLIWEPGWQSAHPETYERRVRASIEPAGWIMDGNHSTIYDFVWKRVDTVIWLDYGLPIILWRQLRRAKRRLLNKEECCNGNYESFRRFFSRDSIVLWALRTYRKRRRQYRTLFARPEFAHLTVIHFRKPQEAEHWFQTVLQTEIREPCDSKGVG